MQIRENARIIFFVRAMLLSLSPVLPSFLSGTVIPQLRATVPQKSHPSIAEQSSGIFELILSCHNAAFFLFLSQHSVFLLLSYRNIFSLPVTPAYPSILSLRPPSRSPGCGAKGATSVSWLGDCASAEPKVCEANRLTSGA